jgi:DNA-binding transcriptional regulator GbsR (MarR family)
MVVTMGQHESGQNSPTSSCHDPQWQSMLHPALTIASRIPLDKAPALCDISVMTETTVHTPKLPPAVERFVLHWGEMGAVWGTNRSVGQIHALLYLSDAPQTAEDLAATLGLARSNVSNSLKELLTWNLIQRVSIMGDRRDFYTAETDVWEMVTRIAEGRKARELDPTFSVLKACAADAGNDRFMSAITRQRMEAMRDFVEMVDTWSADIRKVPRSKLMTLMKLGSAIARFLPGKADPTGPPKS